MKKNKILTYVAAFVVTVSTFTLIQGYFPFFMKSWIFFSSLVILITLLYPMVYLEKSIEKLLKMLGSQLVKSITCDQEEELAEHEHLATCNY